MINYKNINVIFIFLFLFSSSAFSMTQSEAFQACYSYAYPGSCLLDSAGRNLVVCVNSQGGVCNGSGYWGFDNRNTASCNQAILNIDSSIDISTSGIPTASRGGAVKQPIDFGKLAIWATGGAAVGGPWGALGGAAISAIADVASAYFKSKAEVGGNTCIINQSISNSVSNFVNQKSVGGTPLSSLPNPTPYTPQQIKDALGSASSAQLKVILQGMSSDAFDCIVSSACSSLPSSLPASSTPSPSLSSTSSPVSSSSTTCTAGDACNQSELKKNTSDTAKNTSDTNKKLDIANDTLNQILGNESDYNNAQNSAFGAIDAAWTALGVFALGLMSSGNDFFADTLSTILAANPFLIWLPQDADCFGEFRTGLPFTTKIFVFAPCVRLADLRDILYWFFYVSTAVAVFKIIFAPHQT